MPSFFALALLTSLGATDSVPAQVARFDRMAAAARAVLAADAGRFWGARLDGVEWMAVLRTADGGGRAYLTASPAGVASGYEPVDAGQLTLYAGALPPGVAPANTSVEWGGRRWAMVVLPLPSDSADAVRLLVHEAMHTLQGRAPATGGALLPSPAYGEAGAGAALLDRPEGRVWLQLEERALHAALLASTKGAQQRALLDALLFRARRYAAATPDERVRERALDVGEGLPEYTAWALTAGTGAAAARVFAPSLERAAAQPSYVRAFPYATGPAYAFLVDQSLSGWRRHVMAHGGAFDLQELALTTVSGAPPWLAAALGDTTAAAASVPEPLARAADAAAARYGYAALRAAEDARWAAREREIAALRRRFVDGPTLRLRPGALRISFDPRAQTPLGDAGTVMRGLTWKGDAGAELDAPDGALVSPDWSELRVPLDGGVTPPPSAGASDTTRHFRAAAWSLTLPAGWRITADGASWLALPR